MFPFPNPPVQKEQKTLEITTAEYDLHKAGFAWITNNMGVHLQIMKDEKVVADFWPTTARWSVREKIHVKKKRKGFGIDNLIKELT